MIVTCHMCMPAGDAMRARFSELMELMKLDNRAVIAAMLRNRSEVPDTVGELGLTYDPAQHRLDERGQPIMDLYGMRDMIGRGSFSCGDAVIYEAAVWEEKYGVPTRCMAVPQGDDDMHGVFAMPRGAVDPTANFLSGRRTPIPTMSIVDGSSCVIEDGRVVCVEDDACAVDENGVWYCPTVPGLSGRRAPITAVQQSPSGQMWARTREGAVVPVRSRR